MIYKTIFITLLFFINSICSWSIVTTEDRMRNLANELRCMVCQNQSIDDSDAPLAADLRMLIREQIQAGKTDDEILDFIEDRYGEFALLQPRLDFKNAPLWGLPFLMVLVGFFLMRSFFRNSPED